MFWGSPKTYPLPTPFDSKYLDVWPGHVSIVFTGRCFSIVEQVNSEKMATQLRFVKICFHHWLVVSKIFFMFIPTCGNNPIWLAHIFQMGWFNHQPDNFTWWNIFRSQKRPTKAAYKETGRQGVYSCFWVVAYGWGERILTPEGSVKLQVLVMSL